MELSTYEEGKDFLSFPLAFLWLIPVGIYLLYYYSYIPAEYDNINGFFYPMLWYVLLLVTYKMSMDMGKSESNQFVAENIHMPFSKNQIIDQEGSRYIGITDFIDTPYFKWPIKSKTVFFPKDAKYWIGDNLAALGSCIRYDEMSIPAECRKMLYDFNLNKNVIFMFKYYIKGAPNEADVQKVIKQVEEHASIRERVINEAYDTAAGKLKWAEDINENAKRLAKQPGVFSGFFQKPPQQQPINTEQ